MGHISMSVDFPRAWQIIRASRPEDHHPNCSYVVSSCFLCDCGLLRRHPEYQDDILQGIDGIPCNERVYIMERLEGVVWTGLKK
jgi:hypothetical protein